MAEKQLTPNRRSFAKGILVVAGAASIAGCANNNGPSGGEGSGGQTVNETPANSTVNPANPQYNGTTSAPTETSTATPTSTPEPDLSGREHYFNWIHGENEEILNEVKGEGKGSISFNAINNALEEGFEEGGRNRAIANALETASEQYQVNNNYEDRHRHILSALHTTLEQKQGEKWNFDVLSNMNYTQTTGTTIQYSEIKVATGETTETGEDEYAIINGALSERMNHATHIPGEDGGEQVDYKRTMEEVRNSSVDTMLPINDVEAIRNRAESVEEDEEGWLASTAANMGYRLFTGGHKVHTGFEYRPDEMLVPASEEIHAKIDEIGYEQGDRIDEEGNPLGTHGRVDLQLAINERYMDEGYDEVDNPVVIDGLEETADGWEFELREEPDWNHEKGYPATAQ